MDTYPELQLLAFNDSEIRHFMELALQIAERGLEIGEVPVGCLLVHIPSKQIMGFSYNLTSVTRNATRHCEIECFAQLHSSIFTAITSEPPAAMTAHADFLLPTSLAPLDYHAIHSVITPYVEKYGLCGQLSLDMERLGYFISQDCCIVVTVEPCVMCSQTISLAGVKLVYAGCGNDRFGGCGSVLPCHICVNPVDWRYASAPSTFLCNTEDMRCHVTTISAPEAAAATTVGASTETTICNPTDDAEPSSSSFLATDTPIPHASSCSSTHPSASLTPTPPPQQQFVYIQGCLRDRAVAVLQRFYARGNPKAPDHKRERPLCE